MIYPDYYSLEYWQDSMGWNLTMCALVTYLVGLVLILFCDQFPRRRMLVRIYAKISKREVIEGYTEEDDSISSCESGTSESEEDDGLLVGKLYL
jgi:hypothetical protein